MRIKVRIRYLYEKLVRLSNEKYIAPSIDPDGYGRTILFI